MVLYLSTGYRLLGIVYLDQLQGARHTHTSSQDNPPFFQKRSIAWEFLDI